MGRIVATIRNILIGWGKHWEVLPTQASEKKLSELRMTFCLGCDRSRESKILSLIEGSVNQEVKLVCRECGCACIAKTLVLDSKCPLNKW